MRLLGSPLTPMLTCVIHCPVAWDRLSAYPPAFCGEERKEPFGKGAGRTRLFREDLVARELGEV